MDTSHIALMLGESDSSLKPNIARRSWRRQWNSLPRFQKNLIFTLTIAFIFTLFFLLPSYSSSNQSNKSSRSKLVAPNLPNQEQDEFIEHNNHYPDDDPNSNDIQNKKNRNKIINANHNNNINHNADQEQQQRQQEEGEVQQQIREPEHNDILDKSNDINDMNKNNRFYNNQNNNNNQNNLIMPDMDDLNENEIIDRPIDTNIKEVEFAKDFKGSSNERQRAVVDAFMHAWKGYKEFAWGHDNLKPITRGYHDWFGLGLTIIDSLDTLYIMDLQDEFDEAKSWVENHLRFNLNRDVNLFEVTIRVLGGLLSAYHLSGDKMFLNKATELGNRLLPCFDTPSGIPYSDINLETMKAHPPKWSPDSSTSEVTTLQLEFRDLSYSIGNPVYDQVVTVINRKIHELEKKSGLCPIFINANTGQFREYSTISLGARGDSYYEYLLKQWLQFGKRNDDFLIEDYKAAIDGVLNLLVKRTPKDNFLYIGELINSKDFKPKMDHLVCFLPGTLILGFKNGMPESHLNLARDLLETCYKTYMYQPTHLAPEITYFNVNGENENDLYVKANDAHNLLRPEFVESLYYFYAITGNKTYQDMGWEIFQAFEKYTKVKAGYTSIGNVKSMINTKPNDMMESFWLGETLKYFYLLFSDDRNEIDLEKYVFNTEAHPLPIREIQ